MGESPTSALPQLEGLAIEAVEWLPSGADSGLVRVRARWTSHERARPGLPELCLRAPGAAEQRFESLPDARFARDPASWRGSYLVPAALVVATPAAMWLEWPGGVRSGLPALSPGLADVPAPAEPAPMEEPAGGEVIDRAVLAERRARRAEAAEQAQARVAAEALKAVEALELQSAELERRLAEREVVGDAPDPGREELARIAERRAAALGAALDSLARLRAQSRDWRTRLRTGEIAHAGDAVRLAVLEAERATAGDALRAALHERSAELDEARRLAESRATELAAAGAEAAALRAELSELLADAEERLAAAEQRARGERAVHEEVRSALRERLDAEEARAAALEASNAAERAARTRADAQLEVLRGRAEELEAGLALTETKFHTAAAEAAAAEARLRVESVARAALEDELDRHRAAAGAPAHELAAAVEESARLSAALEAERAEHAAAAAEVDRLDAALHGAREESARLGAAFDAAREESARLAAALDAERAQAAARLAAALDAERAQAAARLAAALDAERAQAAARLEAERAARAAERDALTVERDEAAGAAGAELAAERERRAAAEADLEAARAELAGVRAELDAARQGGATLLERIAELDRTASGLADEARLERAAREQAEAAAAAARRPEEESGRMLADLDAAAAALREATPPPVEPEPEPDPHVAATVDDPEVPTAAPPRARPTIVSAAGPPPRLDATGRSARDYPPLRGAIVKLAHDDPETAGRLIAALLPAQAAALPEPADYDITIKETGTFAVTVAGTWTHVKPLDEPRPRGEADFHLTADALTLAELLAGVPRRIGRLIGPARVRGNARRARRLKALADADLSVSEAVRAGAALDARLVYRALAYAVHPSWTKGERFTVAQQITGGETWYLTARDGAGLAISERPPAEGVDAIVEMTSEAFRLLLRGEPLPRGERPMVRGDRRAVALMKAWTDRAQGS